MLLKTSIRQILQAYCPVYHCSKY
uniref:Uncharacterized protein n=1 Tax=Arundo donax TaxID=35708 RepID=A0A0A9ATF4_ARUDO